MKWKNTINNMRPELTNPITIKSEKCYIVKAWDKDFKIVYKYVQGDYER